MTKIGEKTGSLIKYIFFKNYPAQVILFVTSRCNLRCKMCFYWQKIDDTDLSQELTFNEIKAISENMKPFFWLMIGGGEPFLRKDLADICELFCSNNKVKHISIPTNGFYNMIPEIAGDILKRIGNAYLNINFSLDDIGERHDEIRGVAGSFQNMIKSFNATKRLKNIYPNLGIGITITYSTLNQSRILEILDYIVDNLKPDNVAFTFVRGDTRERVSDNLDLDIYKKLTDKMTDAVASKRLSFYNIPFKHLVYAKDILMRRTIYNTKKLNSYQMPCYAGRLSIVISETGDVFPCEIKKHSLGNLKNHGYNLNRILTKDVLKYLKYKIEKSRCFCTHECFYTINILFNPRRYTALFIEWMRLLCRMKSL